MHEYNCKEKKKQIDRKTASQVGAQYSLSLTLISEREPILIIHLVILLLPFAAFCNYVNVPRIFVHLKTLHDTYLSYCPRFH